MSRNNESIKFARYISDFLTDYAPHFLTYSPHTIKSYQNALRLYVIFLESINITPSMFNRKCFEREYIEKWICWLIEERKCCPDSCNVRLASLRVFLEYIAKKDIELMYLFSEAKIIKRQKCMKKKVVGLSKEAVTTIINEADMSSKTGRRDYTLLMLLYGTAARIGEILSLKIEHLNLNTKKPYVTLKGKGGKIRTAYLLPRIVTNLKGYIREYHGENPNPNDYLFYSRVGDNRGMLTEVAIDKRIKKYAASANEKCNDVPINTHAHQFRHAKATHWLEEGMNIVQISFLLGHENIETTMKYLDITTNEKIAALATLESEREKQTEKKWKVNKDKLSDFLGL